MNKILYRIVCHFQLIITKKCKAVCISSTNLVEHKHDSIALPYILILYRSFYTERSPPPLSHSQLLDGSLSQQGQFS